jgi:hypothetical protein
MQQPSSRSSRPPRKRDVGLMMLAFLAAVDGLFDALAGATLLGVGLANGGSSVLSGGIATLVGMVLLVFAFLLLSLAYGLWLMRPWAWSLGVGLEAANILLALARATGGREALPGVLLTLLLAGTILYYLWQRPVRAIFGRS